MPQTCKTCQFNDDGYCQKFDDEIKGEFVSCSEYIYKEWTPIDCSKEKICLCDDIKGGHSIDCDYYQEAVPSWQDIFVRDFTTIDYNGADEFLHITGAYENIIKFFRQTIAEEREDAELKARQDEVKTWITKKKQWQAEAVSEYRERIENKLKEWFYTNNDYFLMAQDWKEIKKILTKC